MKWTISNARRRFSALLKAAAEQPQEIYNRNRLVATVVDAVTYQAFAQWHKERSERSIATAFSELRRICAEDGYQLEVPERKDRPNDFAEALNEVPG